MANVVAVIRVLLALVWVVSAVTKLRDRAGAREASFSLGVPERLAGPAATLLPIVELATACLLIPVSTARIGAGLSLDLLAAFTALVGTSLARGRRPACHCFGSLSAAPIGARTVVRNAALAVPTVAVLASDGGVLMTRVGADASAFGSR